MARRAEADPGSQDALADTANEPLLRFDGDAKDLFPRWLAQVSDRPQTLRAELLNSNGLLGADRR